jgi:undecaprenyl-diphosphatase
MEALKSHTDVLEPHPPSASPHALVLAGWLAFFVAGTLFFSLAWNVSSAAAITQVDTRVANWLHAHHAGPLTAFMLVVTHANSTIAMTALSVGFAYMLWRMRELYWMLTLAAAMIGGLTLNVMLKHAYERARPEFEDPVVVLHSFSFPSGHTTGATLFYGVLAAFLVSRYYDHRRRVAIVVTAIVVIALVAFSRMYLGAHFLSDVLAAVSSSTAWLVVCLSAVHGLVKHKRIARQQARKKK